MNSVRSLKTIIPIRSAEHLESLLNAQHSQANSFQLPQAVLDKFSSGKRELVIPANMDIDFNGEGRDLMNLRIGENAVFNAPKATFGNVLSSAQTLILKAIRGDNFAAKGEQKIGKIFGNNVGSQTSKQTLGTVEGNNSSQGFARQIIEHIRGITSSYGESQQTITRLDGAAKKHGNSQITVLRQKPVPSIYEGILGGG